MFALKHVFYPGQPIYARQIQENFSDIEAEINAYPTDGAFKTGSLTTTHFINGGASAGITGSKFVLDGTFSGLPLWATSPSADNGLCKKGYITAQVAAVITAIGGVGTGITTFSPTTTTSFHEADSFDNGGSETLFMEYGYAKSSGSGTTQTITLNHTSGGLMAVMVTAVRATGTSTNFSVTSAFSTGSTVTYYSNSAIYIYAADGLANIDGFFYTAFSGDL